MLLGLFGVKIALLYIASGLLIAIFSGIIIGKIGAEKLLESSVLNQQNKKNNTQVYSSWQDRTKFAKNILFGF